MCIDPLIFPNQLTATQEICRVAVVGDLGYGPKLKTSSRLEAQRTYARQSLLFVDGGVCPPATATNPQYRAIFAQAPRRKKGLGVTAAAATASRERSSGGGGGGLGGRRGETRATAFSPSPSPSPPPPPESGVATLRSIVSHDWKAEQRSRGGGGGGQEVVIVVERRRQGRESADGVIPPSRDIRCAVCPVGKGRRLL